MADDAGQGNFKSPDPCCLLETLGWLTEEGTRMANKEGTVAEEVVVCVVLAAFRAFTGEDKAVRRAVLVVVEVGVEGTVRDVGGSAGPQGTSMSSVREGSNWIRLATVLHWRRVAQQGGGL